MTNQHPIPPSLELVHQWADMLSSRSDHAVFSLAAQWGADQQLKLDAEQIAQAYQKGADQELEACCVEVAWLESSEVAKRMRERRRPKPPSLKEQALAVIENSLVCDHLSPQDEAILRRALEALPND